MSRVELGGSPRPTRQLMQRAGMVHHEICVESFPPSFTGLGSTVIYEVRKVGEIIGTARILIAIEADYTANVRHRRPKIKGRRRYYATIH